MQSLSDHPATSRIERIGRLREELTRLIESGAPNADDMAFDIGLEYIRLQAEHITELTDTVEELHGALRLATLPERWCYQA